MAPMTRTSSAPRLAEPLESSKDPTPLLTGALAREAHQAVEDVTQALRQPEPGFLYCRFQKTSLPSLGALDTWTALLFAYRGFAFGDSSDSTRVEEILEESYRHLGTRHRLDLYGGWCELGWALAHLTEVHEEEDDLTELDHGLVDLLSVSDLSLSYDLIDGLAGFGVYLLERLPRPEAAEGLRRLVRQLEGRVKRTAHGLAWPDQDGSYNLGVAHGIPGILALLALCHRAGIELGTTATLLDGAVPWLLQQQLTIADRPRFPRARVPGQSPKPCRIAWCYGDLGVAAVLHLAGGCLQRPEWQAEAIRIACHAARVPETEDGVIDPGLCHGSAGNAHIFHRLFQASGKPELRRAALREFQRTLDYRRPDGGIGGFQSFFPGGSEPGWKDDASFLMGASGIALALLAALHPVEPAWERVLLIS